jgi:hypothetical protein
LKPLINLMSADSTHISAPSAMSEVHDNNAVPFEGLSWPTADSKTAQEAEPEDVKGAVKQFFSGVVDDMFGPKKTGS